MNRQNFQDKRKTPRHDTMDVVFISSGEGLFKGSLTNISLYGLRFTLEFKMSCRTIIDINISCLPVNFIQKGYIVWSKEREDGTYEYGAEFINISSVHKLLLEDHIQTLRDMHK